MSIKVWQSPPVSLTLVPQKSVHLWFISLDSVKADLGVNWDVLSPEERQAVARLRSPVERERKAFSRFALRDILSRYLSARPRDLIFQRGPHGKPALQPFAGALPLQFNLSHSQGVALCAVTLEVQVGVDIEWMRQGVDFNRISTRFFAKEEAGALLDAPATHRSALFYRYWTLKEAYIKAVGRGISACPLKHFWVDPSVSEPWGCLRRAESRLALPERWALGNVLPPVDQYMAALALPVEAPCLTKIKYTC